MRFCTECGTELGANAKFCQNCGQKTLNAETPQDANAVNPQKTALSTAAALTTAGNAAKANTPAKKTETPTPAVNDAPPNTASKPRKKKNIWLILGLTLLGLIVLLVVVANRIGNNLNQKFEDIASEMESSSYEAPEQDTSAAARTTADI